MTRQARAAVAAAVFAAVATTPAAAGAAPAGCMTTTTLRTASVICEGGIPHQAHELCRPNGVTVAGYYRHGTRYTGYERSTASCNLGDHRAAHWYTYT